MGSGRIDVVIACGFEGTSVAGRTAFRRTGHVGAALVGIVVAGFGLLLGAQACGGSEIGGSAADAGSDAHSGPPTGCPEVPDAGWSPDDLTRGPCVGSGTCDISAFGICPDGVEVPGEQWGCVCEAGSWACDLKGGPFVPCPDDGGAWVDGGWHGYPDGG